MKVSVFTFLLFVFGCTITFAQPTSTSGSYSLLHGPVGGTGGQVSGGIFNAEITSGDSITGGVSEAMPSNVVDKGGYTGQLYDGVSLTLSASPSTTIDAGSSASITGDVILDDGTSLLTGELRWRILNGPFTGIDEIGNFTAGYPRILTTTELQGVFDTLTETISLSTTPIPVDPYAIPLDDLGGSGGPYRVLFGESPNSLSENMVSDSSFAPADLDPGQTYYWQVFDNADANITPGGDGPVRLLAGANVEMVQVGNPGNAPGTTGFGAVTDEYWMGILEITNRQYTDFLNAIAASDPNGLFETSMENNPRGGIVRVGAPGSYTYAPKDKMADKPVNFVSFWSVCRYSNWLHNGLPNGDQNALTTETGAYDLTEPAAITANTVTRGDSAAYFIPDNDEWDKAAYHDPRSATLGGPADDGNYWLYPTVSDTPPSLATADAAGNIDNDSDPIANYSSSADWNGQDGNVTTVGSGGIGSGSFYGVRDMAGNLQEWIQDIDGNNRATRGGHFNSSAGDLENTAPFADRLLSANFLSSITGFRVAAPEETVAPPISATVLPSPVNYVLRASLSNKLKKLKKKFKKAKKAKKKSKAKKLKKAMKKLKNSLARL